MIALIAVVALVAWMLLIALPVALVIGGAVRLRDQAGPSVARSRSARNAA